MKAADQPKPAAFGVRRNGWHILCHPAVLLPLLGLADEVARLREPGGDGWLVSPKARLLAHLIDIVLNEVPADPGNKAFEQGNTLGADLRGWRRVKFLGRFRLFFRFDTKSKIIVYAWVNDENTLRKSGARTDPYAMFRSMVIGGDPPHGWDALLKACEMREGDPSFNRLSTLLTTRPETIPEPRIELPGPGAPKRKRR